jgi:hypothetical protein
MPPTSVSVRTLAGEVVFESDLPMLGPAWVPDGHKILAWLGTDGDRLILPDGRDVMRSDFLPSSGGERVELTLVRAPLIEFRRFTMEDWAAAVRCRVLFRCGDGGQRELGRLVRFKVGADESGRPCLRLTTDTSSPNGCWLETVCVYEDDGRTWAAI